MIKKWLLILIAFFGLLLVASGWWTIHWCLNLDPKEPEIREHLAQVLMGGLTTFITGAAVCVIDFLLVGMLAIGLDSSSESTPTPAEKEGRVCEDKTCGKPKCVRLVEIGRHNIIAQFVTTDASCVPGRVFKLYLKPENEPRYWEICGPGEIVAFAQDGQNFNFIEETVCITVRQITEEDYRSRVTSGKI